MMSARSAGCMRSSFWCVMRSFTRRSGSGSIKLTNSQGMDRAGSFVVCTRRSPIGRHHAVEQAPSGAREANVHLRDAQFRVAVGALLGQIDIVYANHFTAVGIDDLLIQQILSHGQPGFVGLVELQRGLIRGQVHPTGLDGPYLVVSGNQRAVLAASNQQTGYPIWLLGGDDEEFLHPAHKIACRIIRLSAQNFSCVQHNGSLKTLCGAKKKPVTGSLPGHGQTEKPPTLKSGPASPPCSHKTNRPGEHSLYVTPRNSG